MLFASMQTSGTCTSAPSFPGSSHFTTSWQSGIKCCSTPSSPSALWWVVVSGLALPLPIVPTFHMVLTCYLLGCERASV